MSFNLQKSPKELPGPRRIKIPTRPYGITDQIGYIRTNDFFTVVYFNFTGFIPGKKSSLAFKHFKSIAALGRLVRQIEDQNYGKLTISWDNSILPSYCALKASKYVSVCWPR